MVYYGFSVVSKPVRWNVEATQDFVVCNQQNCRNGPFMHYHDSEDLKTTRHSTKPLHR